MTLYMLSIHQQQGGPFATYVSWPRGNPTFPKGMGHNDPEVDAKVEASMAGDSAGRGEDDDGDVGGTQLRHAMTMNYSFISYQFFNILLRFFWMFLFELISV